MAAWWGDTLFCLKMREWIGGRGVRLSKLVELYPGRINVYRADLGRDERKAAVDAMRQATGTSYGWLTILWLGRPEWRTSFWTVRLRMRRWAPSSSPATSTSRLRLT